MVTIKKIHTTVATLERSSQGCLTLFLAMTIYIWLQKITTCEVGTVFLQGTGTKKKLS